LAVEDLEQTQIPKDPNLEDPVVLAAVAVQPLLVLELFMEDFQLN
jgi:hypothetical protein